MTEYKWGDADLNNTVNIKDATLIQKVVAQMELFESEKAREQADVNGDDTVNIKDATTIQKFVAKMIDVFPAQTDSPKISLASVGTGELGLLLKDVKTILEEEYCYASYDMYMALKKVYFKYKDASQADTSAVCDEINEALDNYNLMKENNPVAGVSGGEITIYFTNNKNWKNVNAYVWGSDGYMSAWPGKAMTYAKTNSQGQDIYSITFDSSSYQNIIFSNNGSSQTVDITLTGESGIGYYISGTSGGKNTCSTYIFA